MKKFLKLQAKKSISLFLAVLMVLSCWVWIAPEKAEAANSPDEGYYYVEVRGWLRDTAPDDTIIKNEWVIKHGSSTTTLTSNSVRNGGVASADDQYVLAYGWVKGFPTGIKHTFEVGKSGCDQESFNVRGVDIWVGSASDNIFQITNDTDGGAEGYGYWCENGSFEDNSIIGGFKEDSAPKAKDFRPVSGEVETWEVTVPKLGSNEELSKTFSGAGIYDQYGVKLDGDVTYFVSDANMSVTYTEDGEGIWSEGTTVKLNANVQKNITDGKAYLVASQDPEKGIIANIVLKYQQYNLTVDPKGSVTASGFNPTITLTDNSTQTGNWTYTGSYGATASTYPKDTTEATGYEFKGFWTKQQPTTGDAGINASEATFAEPVDQATFDIYKAQEGATVDGSYVTLSDGKKYYNAGTKWDGAVHKEILGDATFYAWWIPQDIPVKFYDIDGKYLGTVNFKYGDTIKAESKKGEVPTARDEYDAGKFEYKKFINWRDISGQYMLDLEDESKNFVFGSDGRSEYTLTPVYETKTYDGKSEITFITPVGTEIKKEYAYRDILEGTEIPDDQVTIPNNLVGPDYSYAFKGWTTQKPASGNYHLVDKDSSTIAINTDWVVRDDITYYAVIERTVKVYKVEFKYKDATGEDKTETISVPYGAILKTPEKVNRTYASEGMGYTLESWKYGDGEILDVNDTLVFNKEKIDAINDTDTAIVFEAQYDDGEPMPYTITFKYMAVDGTESSKDIEVEHGKYITKEQVDEIYAKLPSDIYGNIYADDNDYRYHFQQIWIITEGKGTGKNKENYTIDDLYNFSPTSNVVFEAVYDEGTPYYTVTYIDGSNQYSERLLAGEEVPAWMVTVDGEEKEYAPSKADTETGTYNFEGWFDESQTDKDFAQTNGTEYTTDSIVNDNLTLYPQFIFEPFKFTIKFMNFDGSVQLAIAEVEAGQSFEAAFIEAQRAAQYRAPDDTYSYEFIGWDNVVPDNYLCEGDVTYTALYKPSYIYYSAKWFNSKDAMNAAADPLATTKHTFNSQVYNPAVELTPPTASEGKVNVFDGWYYVDDTGIAQPYVRGMVITKDMSFYATYKEEAQPHTVTTIVNDNPDTYTVGHGKVANIIPRPVDGYKNITYHQTFAGWYTDAEYNNEFDIANTAITEDITIYAKFETAKHSKTMKELVTAPTYYAKGSEEKWCACSYEKTFETVEIPMLTDTVAPTGTIYLGGYSWSSTGTPAYETDNDPISIFVNANADIVITSNDKGDVNDAYNPSGIGKGVAKIRAFAFPAETVLTAENYGAAQSLAVDVYTNNTQDLNNNANFSIKVGDIFVADLAADGSVQYDDKGNVKYKDLEDGESYIIYYYVNDKAGNQLNRLVRTAKFIYDATAPDITVNGDNNDAKVPTYCGKAVVKGIENGSTVLVNGEKVTLTTSGAAGTSNYTIAEAGNYVITVTDKAGNTASKKIVVADGHNTVTTEQAAACGVEGYKNEVCVVCEKTLKAENYPALEHNYTETTISATCVDDKIEVKTCSLCGDTEETVVPDSALGHNYKKVESWTEDANNPDNEYVYVTDENGEATAEIVTKTEDGKTLYKIMAIDYTVVTKATCKTEGKAVATCTNGCGETKTKVLEIDANAHVYGNIKTLRPTCTENGKTYQTCKYCYVLKDGDTIEATGHSSTQTVITTYPTCNVPGEQKEVCTKCGVAVSKPTEIPATGNHKWVASEDADKTFDATEEADGQITYYCEYCGESKVETIKKLEKYTVTFYAKEEADADNSAVKAFADMIVGETIDASEIVDENGKAIVPEKASDTRNTYKFAGWVDADGNAVKFPITVASDMAIYPSFKDSTRIYTHKFLVPTSLGDSDAARTIEYADYAEIIGVYEDTNKKPATEPKFTHYNADTDAELKLLYTYEFKGWANTSGEIVTDFTMTDDATFHAVFDVISNEFTVIFYDEDRSTVIDSYIVDAKGSVTYSNTEKVLDENGEEVEVLIVPTKNFDAEKHYSFAGWLLNGVNQGNNVEITINNVTSNTRVYATYDGTPHTYTVDSVTDATCAETGLKKYKCTVCGSTKEETLDLVDHNYELQADGSKKCSVCGDVIEAEAKLVTITFVDGDNNELKKVEVAEGKTYTYSAPDKATTAQYVYTFINWVDANNAIVSTSKEITVTAGSEGATYKAIYAATVRAYNVIYFNEDGSILDRFVVNYGDSIPAYTKAEPTKDSDDYNHYSFSKWNQTKGIVGTVTGQTEFTAVFAAEEHSFTAIETKPTCTTPGGTRNVCSVCNKSTAIPGKEIPVTDHDYKVISETPAKLNVAGSKLLKCSVCGNEKTESIPAIKGATIKIRVYNKNGDYATDALVELWYTENGVEKRYEVQMEGYYNVNYPVDKTGYVSIVVPANYTGWRAKIYYAGGSYNNVVNTGDAENVFGAPNANEPDDSNKDECSCSCHKNTFWGLIFRLFQKIVKLFAGKAKCCSNPDSRI